MKLHNLLMLKKNFKVLLKDTLSPKAREEALKKLEELTQDANCRRTTANKQKSELGILDLLNPFDEVPIQLGINEMINPEQVDIEQFK
jgi:hypothetical protein